MANPSVITLRVPFELKERVAQLSTQQGVSVNQFLNYTITEKVSVLETEAYFDSFLNGESKEQLLSKMGEILATVSTKNEPLPEWDRLPESVIAREAQEQSNADKDSQIAELQCKIHELQQQLVDQSLSEPVS